VLIGLDEYPLHQISHSFSGTAGSDPQWNDGHYVCVSDLDGNVCMTSNVRLYQNNDVLDGFVCIRHEGRQHNIRLSRRLRPDMEHFGVGPLRIEILEPMRTLRFVLEDNDFGIACDVLCSSTVLPYEDPVEITRVDGRLLSERVTYELVGVCEGFVEVAGTRHELTRTASSFFRNHSWGNQAGRGGPRYGVPRPSRRVPGVRQWVLFHSENHGGFYFVDPSGRAASGKGAILLADGAVPVTDVESELEFYEGGRRVKGGTFRLTDADGTTREYSFTDLGWVYCQGGGYFGGFDDHLGQGVYRGDLHVEGEVWDVSHPTRVVDDEGRSFEFDHDWAESFVRLRGHGPAGDPSAGTVGLAHFECVVIRDPGAAT
jgi:hypothetical protein